MLCRMRDADALPQAVLESCQRPFHRRGAFKGPSWKYSHSVEGDIASAEPMGGVGGCRSAATALPNRWLYIPAVQPKAISG